MSLFHPSARPGAGVRACLPGFVLLAALCSSALAPRSLAAQNLAPTLSVRLRTLRVRLSRFGAAPSITARAQDLAAKMRVRLGRFGAAPLVILRAEPGARLLDGSGRECAAGAGPFVLARTGGVVTARDARGRLLGEARSGALWRLQSDDGDTILSVATARGPVHRYRGELEVGCTGSRLHVVNEVGLEDYVRGVIGPEMGRRAPLEALKAQAVASRTFALSSLGHWTSDGYDLRDSTDSQVYSGVEAESAECDRAVRETEGLVLTRGGRPIEAFFCADCGGVTAPGDTPDACPGSVSDLDAHGSKGAPLPPTWTLTVAPERLAARLAKAAPAGMVLADLMVSETDISGRARRLRAAWLPGGSGREGAKGPKSGGAPAAPGPPPESDLPEGTVPGGAREPAPQPGGKPAGRKEGAMPSGAIVTDISTGSLRLALGPDALRSTLFRVRRGEGGAFLFEGRGWGHGRGMCQVGAIALAGRGLDFRVILARYYVGSTLSPLAGSEEGQEGVPDPAEPAGRR